MGGGGGGGVRLKMQLNELSQDSVPQPKPYTPIAGSGGPCKHAANPTGYIPISVIPIICNLSTELLNAPDPPANLRVILIFTACTLTQL